MPSNESDKNVFPQPKEDFYGKNILESTAVRSTITSLWIVEKYFNFNLQIFPVIIQQLLVIGKWKTESLGTVSEPSVW